MNCPNCDNYTLAKHCNENEKCPWSYCQRCKIDFDKAGRSKKHETKGV